MATECDNADIKILKSRGLLAVIDVGRTRKANEALFPPDCSCLGCENYRAAFQYAHVGVKNFLASLGLDVRKLSEISHLGAMDTDPQEHAYSGFFHMVGQLHGVGDKKEESRRVIDLDALDHSKHVWVWLFHDVHLLEDGFPTPAVQLEVVFTLP